MDLFSNDGPPNVVGVEVLLPDNQTSPRSRLGNQTAASAKLAELIKRESRTIYASESMRTECHSGECKVTDYHSLQLSFVVTTPVCMCRMSHSTTSTQSEAGGIRGSGQSGSASGEGDDMSSVKMMRSNEKLRSNTRERCTW